MSIILKTKVVTNWAKVILESSYSVLQVTFKWKTLKQPVYFLKAVEFCPTFEIQIDFGYISGKVAKPHSLENPQKSLKTLQHLYL